METRPPYTVNANTGRIGLGDENTDTGKPFYCKACGALLGYIQRTLITIITDEQNNRTITRQMHVLRRVFPGGKRGDLIIGDADIRCACGAERRWDFRRAWTR